MNKRMADEKYLVVEQKGWRVVALGLALAALFSLTFRALFSPRRIQYEIERALSSADPRIKSSLDGAYLSLTDGLWPRLAIVINKLQVQTADPCLFETKAEIQNLVLPVAFSSLMDRTLVFKRVEVGSLQLSMRARREGCGGEVTAIPTFPQTLENTPPPEVPEEDASPITPSSPGSLEQPPLVQTMSVESSFLKHIVFNEIHLQFIEKPQFQWHLKKVAVHLPGPGQTKTQIEGQVTLTSDPTRFPFQGLHANLELESDAELATAKIHGAWREGRVEVEGQWSPHSKDFHWKGSFKQIPWSQLMVLAQALGESGPMPASSQAWVSGQVEWNHDMGVPEQVEVNDGHIEGEFGDFILGKVIAKKVEGSPAWDVETYKVLAKEVDLDILTKMMGWQEPPPAFDRLGIFDGEAQFINNQLVTMAGTWRELSVIFSNRGRREIQVVNNMSLELAGGSNRWSGALRQIELRDGQWSGDVALKLDQNSKTVDVESQFTQLRLNPLVEELMTMKGQITPIEGRVSVTFIDGVVDQLQGFLKIDQATVDEVQLEKGKLDFEGQKGVISGKVQMQSLAWPKTQSDYLPPVFSEKIDLIQMKNLSGVFTKTPTSFALKDMQGQIVSLKSRFQLTAGWEEDSQLRGLLQIRGDRKSTSYLLSGARDNPTWTEKLK
jgi:hypothetical protein